MKSAMRGFVARVAGLFLRRRRDADLTDELHNHLDAHIDDNIRAGLSPREARRQAILRLGGIEMTKESYREQRGLPSLERAARELRHALGRLRRCPGFSAAAALSLALAIGANVSIFAIVERVVLNPLPYPASDRLVMLDFAMPARNIPSGFNSMTARQYSHYAGQPKTFGGLAIYRTVEQTLTGGTAERLTVARTTPSLSAVLRAAPAIGRWLPNSGDQGFTPTAVLSHGLWVRRYGMDAGVLGQTVTLNGVARTVVGVMPASFTFPSASVDMWINEPFDPADLDSYMFTGVARLVDGASLDQFRAEINQLSRTLHPVAPASGYDGVFSTAVTLRDFTIGPVSTMLWILLASAAVVLLVACANIGNLFLVRSEARQREIGVRRALGAGTGGIAGYFFAESSLLSLSGCAIGLAWAWYGVKALVAFGPATLPRLNEVRLAPVHIVFSVGLGAIATLVFGLVPLARLGGATMPLHDSARGATAGRKSHRTRQLLMGAQVALALVLLVASGLLFRSFARLRAIDSGFDASSALTFQVGLPPAEYADRVRMTSTHQLILDRLAAVPGVTAASVVNCLPLSGRGFCNGAPLFVEGEAAGDSRSPGARPIVAARPVGASFFDAMGMRLLAGRALTRADAETNNLVAVVDQALVQTAFHGQDPIGRRIRLGPHVQAQLWFTIVGVVKSTPTISLTEPNRVPKMYVPMLTTAAVWPPVNVMTYVVRTSVAPLGLSSAARDAVKAVGPNLALAQVRTLQDHLDAAAAPRAFTMVLIAVAATATLLLGVIGIYGVTSYIVTQRTNEIGVRLALGAEPAAVTRMIIRQGGTVAIGGIAVGLAAALLGGNLIGSLLYGVSPRDPLVFAATTTMLVAVPLFGCWLPARRAAAVDPLMALRAE